MAADAFNATRSFLPRGLRWSGPILAALYGAGVRLHRAFSSARFAPVATICIGNITVGGTGKTPATIYFARELAKRGRRPAVLMRGYKEQGGDEAEEAKAALREHNIPVILGGDRYRSALEAILGGSDVVLLDDGFQHWRLKRDLDIVLVNATNPFGSGSVLPEGTLREPLSGLGRAGAIVITHAQSANAGRIGGIETEIEKYAPARPILRAHHSPAGVRLLNGKEEWALERLDGLRAIIACGIGNPAAFFGTANRAGVEILDEKTFPDHHAYTSDDIAQLNALGREKGAQAIVVTEKDAVKIEKLDLSGSVPIVALRIEFEIESPAVLWEKIDEALRSGDVRRGAAK